MSGPGQIPSPWTARALSLRDDPVLGTGPGQSVGFGLLDDPRQEPGLDQSAGPGLPDDSLQESGSRRSPVPWSPPDALNFSDSPQESSSDEAPVTSMRTHRLVFPVDFMQESDSG